MATMMPWVVKSLVLPFLGSSESGGYEAMGNPGFTRLFAVTG
jgi:hypothetical protein